MLNEFSVLDPERIEREHFIKHSGLRRGILTKVLVHNRDDVAFGRHDLQRIAAGGCGPAPGARCRPPPRPAPENADLNSS